jgi:hypothetical protein
MYRNGRNFSYAINTFKKKCVNVAFGLSTYFFSGATATRTIVKDTKNRVEKTTLSNGRVDTFSV